MPPKRKATKVIEASDDDDDFAGAASDDSDFADSKSGSGKSAAPKKEKKAKQAAAEDEDAALAFATSRPKAAAASSGSAVASEPAAASAPAPAPAPSAPAAAAAAASPAPAKAKAGKAKAASTSAPDAVLDFMQQQNRPRNAQDVSDHFKGALSKSQAEKHLEALSEAGSVRMKLNGKAKVFWYNQELVPELSAAEKAKLATDLAAAKAQVARGADELAQLQKSLKAGRARRSLDELTAEALTLRMEVQNEEAALAKRKGAKGDGGAPALTEAEAKKVKADYSRLLKEYKKRRRQCLEIVDQISEGCGKPPKKLIEEWGLETDEDYGVNQKDFPILDARPAPAAAPSAAGWRR